MWRRPACQTLSKPFDTLSTTAGITPDLLKAMEILLDATVTICRYRENLKPYWKSEKRPYFSRWSTILLFKGCVRYLNRCTTSPTYILYQLNEKMSLQSLILFSLTLNIAIFKKGARQQRHLFHKPRCLWNLQRENRGKPAFRLCEKLNN